jgi:cbb3-type cytochrome c oxidase subunit II
MPETAAFAEALRVGHKTYIGEACWHCHSQQVRPWGGDEARYGPKSFPEEYHNELNMPPLWGTRRIGPDLIRRGGRHSNDWHVAHFFNPQDVNPRSVMPAYPWFYEDDGLTPNKTGLSIIAYVQWLGSWMPRNDETVFDIDAIAADYRAPVLAAPAPAATGQEQAEEPSEEDFWNEE